MTRAFTLRQIELSNETPHDGDITWRRFLHYWSLCEGNPLVPTLQWRHNERDGVSNHQSHNGLLNRLFRRRSKKTSKLRVPGVTGEFPAQMASNAENVTIWWRHHEWTPPPPPYKGQSLWNFYSLIGVNLNKLLYKRSIASGLRRLNAHMTSLYCERQHYYIAI